MAAEVSKWASISRVAACYRAPELLQGKQAHRNSDIWSLGCILYELVTNRAAFSSSSSVLGCANSNMLTLPIPRGPGQGGDELSIILSFTLEVEASKRPSAYTIAIETRWKMFRWMAKELEGREHYAEANKAYELAIDERSQYPHIWHDIAENIPTSQASDCSPRSRSSSSATIVNLSASFDGIKQSVELNSPIDVAKAKLFGLSCTVLSRLPVFRAGAARITPMEECQSKIVAAIERAILKPQNPKHTVLYRSDQKLLSLILDGDLPNALKLVNETEYDNQYEHLGDIYVLMSDYTEAVKMYKTALRKDPSNMSLRITLGHAYFARAVVAQFNPNKDNSCGQPLLWRRNPEGDYKSEYPKAIKAYSSAEMHCGVGKGEYCTSQYIIQAYDALQHYDQALRTAKRAVKRFPHEWNVWDDLGDTQDKAIRHHCLATFALLDPRSTTLNGDGVINRYFGLALENILDMEDDLIPNFVRLCINAIERMFTADPDHVYLVSGDPVEIAKLKAQWGTSSVLSAVLILEISVKDGVYDDEALFESVDIHTLAGLLLHYLRSLPEPLISPDLYSQLLRLEGRPVLEKLTVESHGNLKMAGAIARDEVQTLLAPTSNFHLINEIAEHLYAYVVR